MKKRQMNYGWIPDVPDRRDLLYRAIRPKKLKIPRVVDLREHCSPVEDQGKLGSCTANALAGNLEFLDFRDDHRHEDASRLFIYYNERALQGTTESDSGASLRVGIKTLAKAGSCAERSWPYEIARFAERPPASCYAEALGRRIASYHRIEGIDEMLGCLAEGYPFVFGFAVYEGFECAETQQTGVVHMPGRDERMLGGHAVMAVGYDLNAQRFLVRNSWGVRWGDAGHCTMPFAYLEMLAADFWTVRR